VSLRGAALSAVESAGEVVAQAGIRLVLAAPHDRAGGMKIALAAPTYGPPPQRAAQSLRTACMVASNHGTTWTGDFDLTDVKQSTIDSVRNRIVREVLASQDRDGTEAIIWIDADIRLQTDAIRRLADHLSDGKDFVTGLYRHKGVDGSPLVGIVDESMRGGKGAVVWMTEWLPETLAPVDACGFGCVLTSTKLLRALGPNPFTFGDFSEDFEFCLKAKRAGFQLYVDTAIKCGHVGEREWTVEEYEAAWARGDHRDHPSKRAAAQTNSAA
jgi:hypothetical protein